jgi:hypothetical protein
MFTTCAGQLDQFEADFHTDHQKIGDLVDLVFYSWLTRCNLGIGNYKILNLN